MELPRRRRRQRAAGLGQPDGRPSPRRPRGDGGGPRYRRRLPELAPSESRPTSATPVSSRRTTSSPATLSRSIATATARSSRAGRRVDQQRHRLDRARLRSLDHARPGARAGRNWDAPTIAAGSATPSPRGPGHQPESRVPARHACLPTSPTSFRRSVTPTPGGPRGRRAAGQRGPSRSPIRRGRPRLISVGATTRDRCLGRTTPTTASRLDSSPPAGAATASLTSLNCHPGRSTAGRSTR